MSRSDGRKQKATLIPLDLRDFDAKLGDPYTMIDDRDDDRFRS